MIDMRRMKKFLIRTIIVNFCLSPVKKKNTLSPFIFLQQISIFTNRIYLSSYIVANEYYL